MSWGQVTVIALKWAASATFVFILVAALMHGLEVILPQLSGVIENWPVALVCLVPLTGTAAGLIHRNWKVALGTALLTLLLGAIAGIAIIVLALLNLSGPLSP